MDPDEYVSVKNDSVGKFHSSDCILNFYSEIKQLSGTAQSKP